jgi:hypothetical protein
MTRWRVWPIHLGVHVEKRAIGVEVNIVQIVIGQMNVADTRHCS